MTKTRPSEKCYQLIILLPVGKSNINLVLSLLDDTTQGDTNPREANTNTK